MIRAAIAFSLLSLSSCAQTAETAVQQPREIPTYGFRVVREYPHDPRAFTLGLIWLDGNLYESTGHVGQSTIRRVNLDDGRVLQSVDLPRVFGEGLVNWGDQLISITWRDGVGYRWDRRTLRQLGTWNYPGEGWGLTQNGTDIIMSDGSSELRFLDPNSLSERRRINVTADGEPVTDLNELEWVNGEIWANVWRTTRIARIDPATGRVTGWIDLTPLAARWQTEDDNVLNGIAYDPQRRRVFVAGKYWPRLFEIEVTPPAGS